MVIENKIFKTGSLANLERMIRQLNEKITLIEERLDLLENK